MCSDSVILLPSDLDRGLPFREALAAALETVRPRYAGLPVARAMEVASVVPGAREEKHRRLSLDEWPTLAPGARIRVGIGARYSL